tara:strand:- start:1023 stop:1193 length:171 start_codon:yes stop_codon:yes gene_type:complete
MKIDRIERYLTLILEDLDRLKSATNKMSHHIDFVEKFTHIVAKREVEVSKSGDENV